MAADASGNLLRAVSLPTGAVVTLAGDGGLSPSGAPRWADGLGTAAAFDIPEDAVATPGGETIYVSDGNNNLIRAVDVASAVVTTVAGGQGSNTPGFADGAGSNALFNVPVGLALDGTTSYLYVADFSNNRIRAVALATGNVTTLAGNGTLGLADGAPQSAMFGEPNGLAYDGFGTLYIADWGSATIRAVAVVGPVATSVTTIAGQAFQMGYADGAGAAALFGVPNGITCAPGVLYISDNANDNIRTVSLAPGFAVATLAGNAASHGFLDAIGTNAAFYGPAGLVLVGTIVISNLFRRDVDG